MAFAVVQGDVLPTPGSASFTEGKVLELDIRGPAVRQ